ncbi:MAG: RimK family alpha-L-glutamate ligase [Acidilobaceae archaeon]|nr:RimK family alpha-L-glutamate ligase [Acidilobaceae archaeon]
MGISLDVERAEEELIKRALEELGASYELVRSSALFPLGKSSFPPVVLIRNISAANSMYMAAIVESSGSRAVNGSRAIALGHDKLLTYAALIRRGLRVPESWVALDGAELEMFAQELSYPLIDKPPVGSWGRLVSLVKSAEALAAIAAHRRALPNPLLRVHIVQRPAQLGRDVRCLAVGGRAVACMERRGRAGEWRSNAAMGGSAVALKASSELEELSLKAAEAVGAEVAGVDLLYGEDGLYVNEVNVVPEFKALYQATGVNVGRAIAEYLLSLRR